MIGQDPDALASERDSLQRRLAIHEMTASAVCGAEGGCEAEKARLRAGIAALDERIAKLDDAEER